MCSAIKSSISRVSGDTCFSGCLKMLFRRILGTIPVYWVLFVSITFTVNDEIFQR